MICENFIAHNLPPTIYRSQFTTHKSSRPQFTEADIFRTQFTDYNFLKIHLKPCLHLTNDNKRMKANGKVRQM